MHNNYIFFQKTWKFVSVSPEHLGRVKHEYTLFGLIKQQHLLFTNIVTVYLISREALLFRLVFVDINAKHVWTYGLSNNSLEKT